MESQHLKQQQQFNTISSPPRPQQKQDHANGPYGTHVGLEKFVKQRQAPGQRRIASKARPSQDLRMDTSPDQTAQSSNNQNAFIQQFLHHSNPVSSRVSTFRDLSTPNLNIQEFQNKENTGPKTARKMKNPYEQKMIMTPKSARQRTSYGGMISPGKRYQQQQSQAGTNTMVTTKMESINQASLKSPLSVSNKYSHGRAKTNIKQRPKIPLPAGRSEKLNLNMMSPRGAKFNQVKNDFIQNQNIDQLYVAQQNETQSLNGLQAGTYSARFSNRESGNQQISLRQNRKLRHLALNTKSGQLLPQTNVLQREHISKLPSTLNPNNEVLFSDQSPTHMNKNRASNYQTTISQSLTEQKTVEQDNNLRSFDNFNNNNLEKSDSKGSSPKTKIRFRAEGDKSGSNQSQELSTISALPPKPKNSDTGTLIKKVKLPPKRHGTERNLPLENGILQRKMFARKSMATIGTVDDYSNQNIKEMLPSEYIRTAQRIDEVSEGQNTNAGPACYKIGHIIGNKKIVPSHIKNQPDQSFGRSQTFRTIPERVEQNNDSVSRGGSPNRSQKGDMSYIALSTGGRTGHFSPCGSQMIFHRLGNQVTPGVCTYETAESGLKQRTKSPNATIGKSIRFQSPDPKKSQNKLQTLTLSPTYMGERDPKQVQALTPKMGTIGKAQRFNKSLFKTETPGVGEYNLIQFQTLGRAAESTFDLGNFHNQYQQIQKKKNDLSPDRRVITQRSNSRETISPLRRRLGGPASPITNYMQGVSRIERQKTFTKENEQQFKGQHQPGPGDYHSNLNPQSGAIGTGRNQFTIPKASRDDGRQKSLPKTPIAHSNPQNEIRIRTVSSPKATIGQSKNKFNPTRMGAVNGQNWQRGMTFH